MASGQTGVVDNGIAICGRIYGRDDGFYGGWILTDFKKNLAFLLSLCPQVYDER